MARNLWIFISVMMTYLWYFYMSWFGVEFPVTLNKTFMWLVLLNVNATRLPRLPSTSTWSQRPALRQSSHQMLPIILLGGCRRGFVFLWTRDQQVRCFMLTQMIRLSGFPPKAHLFAPFWNWSLFSSDQGAGYNDMTRLLHLRKRPVSVRKMKNFYSNCMW